MPLRWKQRMTWNKQDKGFGSTNWQKIAVEMVIELWIVQLALVACGQKEVSLLLLQLCLLSLWTLGKCWITNILSKSSQSCSVKKAHCSSVVVMKNLMSILKEVHLPWKQRVQKFCRTDQLSTTTLDASGWYLKEIARRQHCRGHLSRLQGGQTRLCWICPEMNE